MSRLLLLLPFLLWMAGPPSDARISSTTLLSESILFLAIYLILIVALGLWSRLLSRQIGDGNLHRYLTRFNKVMFAARLMVPAWFAAGLYLLDWKQVAGPMNRWPVQLPAILFGTLPALLAWIGLWWAQYPADRAMREQSMLSYLEENLPLHAPPGLKSYLLSNFRLQVLFTLVPVIFIIAARDIVTALLIAFRVRGGNAQALEAGVSFVAAMAVFVFAPEILRRVLQTTPLPASPLRTRLENICKRFGLGFRDILLWHTQNNMGNAAVMGIIPRVRYILLSDLLLETMSDEQIEAVFAHEVGHIVHRHMAWYVVFFLLLMSMLTVLESQLPPNTRYGEQSMLMAGVVLFVGMFGYLSRKFERQADVFAARTMETMESAARSVPTPTIAGRGFVIRSAPSIDSSSLVSPSSTSGNGDNGNGHDEPRSHVGPYGAAVFASALHRVAIVNNMPISGRNWSHGSIAKRMDYLKQISSNPAHTAHFDRLMFRLYAALLVLLSTFGVWAAVQIWQSG